MTVDKTLLDILVCPETKQPVSVADSTLIESLNAQIESGSLMNRDGKKITEKLTEGLIRKDGQVFYPVRDNIPVMLIEESISITS